MMVRDYDSIAVIRWCARAISTINQWRGAVTVGHPFFNRDEILGDLTVLVLDVHTKAQGYVMSPVVIVEQRSRARQDF